MVWSWCMHLSKTLLKSAILPFACVVFLHQANAETADSPLNQASIPISVTESEWMDAIFEQSIQDALKSKTPPNDSDSSSIYQSGYESFQALALESEGDAVSRWYDSNGWNAALSFVTGDRQGETIIVPGEKLGTGALEGFHLDFWNRKKSPSGTQDGWSGSLMHLAGDDASSRSFYLYRASLTSCDANAMFISHYKNRLRTVSGGLRAIYQEDSFEFGSRNLEAANRMVGPQIGIEQRWHSPSAFTIGIGMKSALLYNYATFTEGFNEQISHRFPIMLQCSAKAGYRFSEYGEIDLRLGGMALSEQKFAIDRGGETAPVRYLTMTLGMRYQF